MSTVIQGALCGSKPENVAWYLEGLTYLLDKVPLHGLFYETGDYGMCSCATCRARPGHVHPYSYADHYEFLPVSC